MIRKATWDSDVACFCPDDASVLHVHCSGTVTLAQPPASLRCSETPSIDQRTLLVSGEPGGRLLGNYWGGCNILLGYRLNK
jgi:hypothetical protein